MSTVKPNHILDEDAEKRKFLKKNNKTNMEVVNLIFLESWEDPE